MKVRTYRNLCAMNEGFEQVRRSLKALAQDPPLQPDEIRRFERLTAEARVATNSYVLVALGAAETDQAGRQYKRRKARERREEQG